MEPNEFTVQYNTVTIRLSVIIKHRHLSLTLTEQRKIHGTQ